MKDSERALQLADIFRTEFSRPEVDVTRGGVQALAKAFAEVRREERERCAAAVHALEGSYLVHYTDASIGIEIGLVKAEQAIRNLPEEPND